MNRGQLAFLVLINAMVSLVIALGVVWVLDARRPDPEELAAIATPRAEPLLATPAAPSAATPADSSGSAATPAALAAPAPATETLPPASPAADEVYVVQPGDTLLAIATRYNITVDDILRANNLTNPDFVFSGQRLVIPVQGAAAARAVATPTPIIQGVQIAAVSSPGDLPNEQVVVVNDSNTPYSLQGWQLARADGAGYTFRSDTPLFPGSSVRIHSGGGSDTTIDLYWGLAEPVWQPGGEAQLINAQGDIVHRFTVP